MPPSLLPARPATAGRLGAGRAGTIVRLAARRKLAMVFKHNLFVSLVVKIST
jgi:hypothetical protein